MYCGSFDRFLSLLGRNTYPSHFFTFKRILFLMKDVAIVLFLDSHVKPNETGETFMMPSTFGFHSIEIQVQSWFVPVA